MEADNGLQVGMFVTKEIIKKTLNSSVVYYEYVQSLTEEQLSKYCLELKEAAFNQFYQWKMKNDVNGPHKSIDYEFEKELLALWHKKRQKVKIKGFFSQFFS